VEKGIDSISAVLDISLTGVVHPCANWSKWMIAEMEETLTLH
jgi:hypothetical protein